MTARDPHGTRLPIKLDSTSNGEFAPIPLEPVHDYANALAREAADRNAKRLGLKRRDFLKGAWGAAATLLAMNEAYAAAGRTGGWFDLPTESALATDKVARDRSNYQENADPAFVTHGPRNRREFLNLLAWSQGR